MIRKRGTILCLWGKKDLATCKNNNWAHTWIFWIYITVPRYSGIDEWLGCLFIYKNRQIDRNFASPSSPDVSGKRSVKSNLSIAEGIIRPSTNGKRACGFVISSGKNKLWLEIASWGLWYGSVNWPGTPSRGKEVNVTGISLGLRCLRARFRLDCEQPMRIGLIGIAWSVPITHITFDRQEIGYRACIWCTGGRFQHISPVLWVKFWYRYSKGGLD